MNIDEASEFIIDAVLRSVAVAVAVTRPVRIRVNSSSRSGILWLRECLLSLILNVTFL
jgi:hypothetical protein